MAIPTAADMAPRSLVQRPLQKSHIEADRPQRKNPNPKPPHTRTKLQQKAVARCTLSRKPSKRNNHIKQLGFSCYSEYLQSDLWRDIRSRVLAATPDCIRCKQPANQVHHSEYTMENLSGAVLTGLWPICGDCHHLAEFDRSGKKTTLGRANRFLGLQPRKKTKKRRVKRRRRHSRLRFRSHGTSSTE